MRTHATRDLPARLQRIRERFEQWRRTREGRSRIPNRLWISAVKAADRYGLNQTARALRLDYYALKKRVETTDSHPEPDREAVASFLELVPPASGSAAECILELERRGGAKMRVHLKGVEAPDLGALSRSFWSATT